MVLETAAGAAERDDQIDLRQWLRIVLKRKWTILVIFVVSAFFSVVMTYLAPPVYRASTTIQIERNVPRLLDYKELTPTVDDDYNADFYQTNYELLKSRAVAERAAEEMGLRKRSDASDSTDPPVVAPEPAPGSAWQELVQHLRKGSTPVAVAPSASKDSAVVGAFQGSLTVEPVRKSRLVRLHFDSTDPYFAARAVNTVAQAFININLERRFEASSYAKTFLEEKLLQTKAKLEESERDLLQFSRELALVNLDEKQNMYLHNFQEYSGAVAKAEQDRIKAEVLFRQAQENPESLALSQENKNIINLKQAKAKVEAEYQDNLKIYKPGFPKMQQLQAQITELDSQIKDEVSEVRKAAGANYKAARTQEGLLRERMQGARQEMLDIQGKGIRYSILKREVDTNRQLYDGLLQRLKEISVAGGVGFNNISVVDRAQVPMLPYKPDLRRNLGLGLTIGLIVGLLVAWLLERLDDTIRFADDVEQQTGAAVLGVVPKLKSVEPARAGCAGLGPHEDPTSAFSEAYRSVRTALQFSTSSGAPRRMVVTSSSKGEGKSTSALALAINFAQMGKPVLIMDADLRNPVLHKELQIENGRGLSNYLSSNVSVLELVHKTNIPNLFVMTSGPLPPNPVELLSSMKLLTLLSQCEEHFAHVIVDGPPILGIADAIVLCNQVDNSVFVVESGRTRKGHAKAALRRLQQAGIHPLGVILTKLDAYHDAYGYHAYYYQYAQGALGSEEHAKA